MTKFKSILKTLDITAGNTFFTLVFFTGIILTCFEIDLYRLTFITFYIPLFIWILTGFAITPFFFKILPKYLKRDGVLYQIVFNILTWGGILIYVFMALNFYFTEPGSTSVSLTITDRGELAKGRSGCDEPYVYVNYGNFNKQIILPCAASTDGFNTVNLILHKGLFGFDIIENKTLSK